MFSGVKDLILRNIQAIESSFLVLEEEDEQALDFIEKVRIIPDEDLGTSLKRRIDQEILKRDYYLERISKFRDWTDTVLVNIESIMKTMGRERALASENLLGKKGEDILLGNDSQRRHFRIESSNLGDSMGLDKFSRQTENEKKRYSAMLEIGKEPQNTFQVRSKVIERKISKYKSSQDRKERDNLFQKTGTDSDLNGKKRNPLRRPRHLQRGSFDL